MRRGTISYGSPSAPGVSGVTSAFTDGNKLYAVRYGSDRQPPTLYTRVCNEVAGTLVVSEPLDDGSSNWSAVPPQSFVTVVDGRVTVSAFAREPAIA